MTTYLSKENISQVNDLKKQEIELPDLGVTVIIKELSASQVLSIQDLQKKDSQESVYRIIAMSIIDESGNRIVSNADASNVIGSWSVGTITLLTNAITALNNLNVKVEDKAKELTNSPLAS